MKVWDTLSKVIFQNHISAIVSGCQPHLFICRATVRTSDGLTLLTMDRLLIPFDLPSLWGHSHVLNWIVFLQRAEKPVWNLECLYVGSCVVIRTSLLFFPWNLNLKINHQRGSREPVRSVSSTWRVCILGAFVCVNGWRDRAREPSFITAKALPEGRSERAAHPLLAS